MSRSHVIDAAGLKLHALEREGSGPAVVMLHGWLDHCHSFDWLAEQLPRDWRLIALDFRGHGESDELPPGATHQFTDHVADVEAAVRHFALERFHLVGHSLGGSVALCYAAARPERVEGVMLIESLGTTGGSPQRAAERLKDFVDDLFKPIRHRVYASVDEAARRVHEANSSYSLDAALHMAKFGTVAVEGGVRFRADPRVKRTSGMALDEEQVMAVFERVKCPVQIIRGTDGMMLDDAQVARRLTALRSPQVFAVKGGHHVHLDSPAEVAAQVVRFIARE